MAGSGIAIPDVITKAYDCLKLKKNAKVLAICLNDDNKPTKLILDCIDRDETSCRTEEDLSSHIDNLNTNRAEKPMNNKEIIDFLKEKIGGQWAEKPHYIVCDLKRTTKGSSKPEVHCIMWNPDVGKLKPKMVLASTYEAFKKKLEGASCFITISDKSDFEGADFVTDALKHE